MIKLDKEYTNELNGLKFIDLFSGIGAFRLALESFKAECVFSADIDKHATQTYDLNFHSNSRCDIKDVNAKDIPHHDILCAGFPCQSFSIAGKQEGFKDVRGTLFFDIIRIIKEHKPKIVFLENVSNLKQHDKGKTFKVIKNLLRNENYNIYSEILNASDFGIPQSRKRIYLICIRKDIDNYKFKFPRPLNKITSLKDILLPDKYCSDFILEKEYQLDESKVRKYNKKMNKPLRVGIVNKGAQGDRIYSDYGHAITLSATSGGNGSKTGLYYINENVRKLHPRETARLMGFPENYKFNESVTQAHKQFGNSIVVDVLQYITCEIINSGCI
ncbi:DNA cytosine methyltransferase [Methanosphaera cuniculi]|uniref:DNA cytosine methyltransferase n=1 Tax=Methanosphaera cuniculi TaxID=1077256 RepID=UPI0026EBA884|nr:DNA cytosine methyltransferase [Methanosphaera cuniculi]